MGTLRDQLLSAENFPRLIMDGKRLIDSTVEKKSGLSGLAIKGGYKMVKTFSPDVIEKTLEALMPSFVDKMEPFWARYVEGGKKGTMRQYCQQHAPAIATALLSITDERARKTQHQTLKSAYEKLRPFAQQNVEEALPDVGEVVSRYVKD